MDVLKALLKKLFEEALGQWARDWLDEHPLFGNLLILGFGAFLLFVYLPYMRRENQRRLRGEKKPRYGWLETGIVVVMGSLILLFGVALVVGWV